MKLIIVFILTFSTVINANCKKMIPVAKQFSNSYIQHLQAPSKWSGSWPKDWIQSNQYLTADFKLSYRSIMSQAFKKDPDFGLGFDPILDAQDFPNNGFSVVECDRINQSILLKGKQWPTFAIKAKLKNVGAQWLINEMGVINNKSYIKQLNKIQ